MIEPFVLVVHHCLLLRDHFRIGYTRIVFWVIAEGGSALTSAPAEKWAIAIPLPLGDDRSRGFERYTRRGRVVRERIFCLCVWRC